MRLAVLQKPHEDKRPAGCTTTGRQFTVVQYGASGGFPDKTSPGPASRGKSLFEGGNAAKSTGTQQISLAAYATAIDSGTVECALSAWLGGYSSQGDDATVRPAFTNAAGSKLGSAALPPVSAAKRKSVTGLVAEAAAGVVPKGARSATVTVAFARLEGEYNAGSADNIALILAKRP